MTPVRRAYRSLSVVSSFSLALRIQFKRCSMATTSSGTKLDCRRQVVKRCRPRKACTQLRQERSWTAAGRSHMDEPQGWGEHKNAGSVFGRCEATARRAVGKDSPLQCHQRSAVVETRPEIAKTWSYFSVESEALGWPSRKSAPWKVRGMGEQCAARRFNAKRPTR